ncbi:DUF4465 domain-containing protein [Flavobacterium sp. ANB]|uniref:DUF4465 domain-containing protein n=1 Tax=unclassified Flavobacterium TaxID=196869 RepID=UPI0012B8CBC2|nr:MULTISPECIES: DUF4465 domain-containing protein [unclassified Flavobacterium]MBF4515779.1 DUF4465 domain-containing protein [Flavobacterium sp. ANB]MTD68782.1 DUF4465 domain-containing protein [Flavobacterium sp. LC2016-13]
MKKVVYFLTLGLMLGFSSCSSDDEVLSNETVSTLNNSGKTAKIAVTDPSIGTTTTLNLTSALLSSGTTTTGGKYWENTYVSNTNLTVDIFKFSHTATSSGYNYWDGFIVSNVNDITNYASGSGSGGSDGWVPHQWGAMAGSGFGTSSTITPGTPGTTGDPYIVAYWSSYLDPQNPEGSTFSESNFSNWIKIGNTGLYEVKGLKINIHPWPYYGCLYGDGFARAFTSGDHFELLIYGVDEDGVISEPITHSLANYTGSSLVMPTGWVNVNTTNLHNLGNVKYLIFQMASTDSDPMYGINTAAYFCLDKLSVQRTN